MPSNMHLLAVALTTTNVVTHAYSLIVLLQYSHMQSNDILRVCWSHMPL